MLTDDTEQISIKYQPKLRALTAIFYLKKKKKKVLVLNQNFGSIPITKSTKALLYAKLAALPENTLTHLKPPTHRQSGKGFT